jgi:hypothetical protein
MWVGSSAVTSASRGIPATPCLPPSAADSEPSSSPPSPSCSACSDRWSGRPATTPAFYPKRLRRLGARVRHAVPDDLPRRLQEHAQPAPRHHHHDVRNPLSRSRGRQLPTAVAVPVREVREVRDRVLFPNATATIWPPTPAPPVITPLDGKACAREARGNNARSRTSRTSRTSRIALSLATLAQGRGGNGLGSASGRRPARQLKAEWPTNPYLRAAYVLRQRRQGDAQSQGPRAATANQMRLVLHTAAYWLILAVRNAIPKTHALAKAEFATISGCGSSRSPPGSPRPPAGFALPSPAPARTPASSTTWQAPSGPASPEPRGNSATANPSPHLERAPQVQSDKVSTIRNEAPWPASPRRQSIRSLMNRSG